MPFFSRKKQQPGPVCTWSAHVPQSGPSPSPFPRDSHTLTATATAAGELFLFGGWAHGAASSDLYAFSTRDYSTTLLQTSGEVPTPCYAHGAALIGTTSLICGSHGGQNVLNHDSLYLLNLVSREWTRVMVSGPGPGGRWSYTTTVVGSKLVVFGGGNGEVTFNDMWTLDLNCLKSQPDWESYEPTPGNKKPLPRAGHVSVTTEDRIIIFGGNGDKGHYYNDTWSFDISTRKWTELQCTGSIPSPRHGHAAVLVDDVMYVFGGFTGITYSDNLYALQLSTQRWFNIRNVGQSPHKRWHHAMASDGTRVFVLGGDLRGARSDNISLIHGFDTKYIEYPDPEPNAVNPNETTQLARKSTTGSPTQEQPQNRKSSSSEAHGSSRLQNATPAVSGRPATHERNPGPNDRSSESEPRRVPEDVREGSTEYHGKFAARRSASEGEVARLELERQLSVSLAVQAERGHRIAQLTDELALKSTLLEQAEANAAEAAKRAGTAGLEPCEHADRLLMQTSLVEQRDAELVDMQAALDELLQSRDQQVGNRNLEVASQDLRSQFSDSQTTVQRLESENKRITRELNKSREAADQYKNEAERLKNGMEELKANYETAIAQARRQAGSLQCDKFGLQPSLDTLKAEMARSDRLLPHMGSPMTPEGRKRSDLLTPKDREMDDVVSPAPSTSRGRGDTSVTFSADGDFNSSSDVSPSRPIQAPNHPSNEVEDLPQYERELTNVRAKLEANESELEAVRLRLTDAEKGLAESKAEADTLRAQTATGSVNRDRGQVTRMLMERMRALEEVASKRWNEKSIEEMECRNEG